MRQLTTTGIICLADDYNFVYKIAIIEYVEREDGYFKYNFKPFYNVIDILPETLFQGIPGLDLSLKRAVYERENIIPTFISERSPSEKREDAWQLLEENNMQTLNRLEWLIRTDKRYSGDRFFVKGLDEVVKMEKRSIYDLVANSSSLIKKLLQIICYGDYLYTDEISIDDNTRKYYYDLLMPMYVHEYERRRTLQRKGIEQAQERNVYLGRRQIKIDPLLFDKVANEYRHHRISAAEAARKLGISTATFFRRLNAR